MAFVILPTAQATDYRQRALLDGNYFRVRLRYNERLDSWMGDFFSVDDVLLVAGVKVVTNWPLTFQHKHLPVPQNDFLAVRSDNSDSDPGLNDLGDSVEIQYGNA